ncbi:MAG: GAF domain-containing protein [Verrucomicrobiota bacterium]
MSDPLEIPIGSLKLRDLRALLNPQQALQRILRAALATTKGDSGSFILLNPNTGLLDIEASHGLRPEAKRIKLRQGQGVTGWVATTGRPLRVNDVKRESRYISVNPEVRSEIALPLEIRGQVVGVLNIDSKEPNAFSPADEHRLVTFASDAAEWLSYAWEIDQLRIKGQQLGTLVDMGHLIVAENNLDEVLDQITKAANRLMATRLCSLMLVSQDGRELVLRAHHGAGDTYRNRPNLPLDNSLVGVVVKRNKPMSVLNVREHQRYRHMEVARREGLVSLLAVPLEFNGNVLGVLAVYTQMLHRFSNEEIRTLTTLSKLSAVAIEKARLLQRIMEMEEQLRTSERLNALGLLAAEVAHEIRNPLTVMQMLFHAMVDNLQLEGDSRRDAQVIAEKMKQMNRIVDQVLGFARSSEPSKEPVELGSLFEDIAVLTRHKLQRQDIKLRRRISAATPSIRVDRSQVEQALLNVILNAVEAMPDGGTIRLLTEQRKIEGRHYLALKVRDTGPGMTPEKLEEIFAPFLTTKETGTGIGLAIVRKIVENHQGKVEVKSALGKGTTFALLFPVEKPGEGRENA